MAQLVLPHTIDAGTAITAAEHQLNYTAIRTTINGDLEGGTTGNLKANGVTARELDDGLLADVLGGGVESQLQEGIIGAGDLKITPGAGLVLNYAAGSAMVVDDSGLLASGALLPVTIAAGSTVTIAANASGNPRLDQIILTLTGYRTGTVSILQGTATAGATIDNRTGAAALPSGAMRLADVLVTNGFAGPFVADVSLRDRRPWARGIRFAANGNNAGDPNFTSTVAWADLLPTQFKRRFEFGGGLVEVRLSGVAYHVTAGGAGSIGISLDTTGNIMGGQWKIGSPAANETDAFSLHYFLPTGAGSHLFIPQVLNLAGAGGLSIQNSASAFPHYQVIEHPSLQSADNGAA
jgi:hypothetical protein